MRRQKLISELFKHCKEIGANQTTLIFLLATMTDRELTKFHLEFMATKKYTDEEKKRI